MINYRSQSTITLLFIICYLVFGTFLFLGVSPAFAIVNPLDSPNNRFGVHIISTSKDESSPAAQLINSSGGDWGYVTVLVESKDRDQSKWQAFFDDLRKKHLIPLVRLATQPEGNFWKLPYEGEEQAWADFLDNLNWPTKNRYIIIYNEPNQGQEWAGRVNAQSYAQILDKTITALKNKNPDFFVLNAGFDASAPNKAPLYQDELSFLTQMNQQVPGIFNKLDGWVSHSYPNPGFAGSPRDVGKGSIKTWKWELEVLKRLGLNKDLPVFITETGWKHAEGIDYDKSLPISEDVAKYFDIAFKEVWNDPKLVAVTPFLLNYQEPPFDHFSFKRLTGEKQNQKILGATYPEYYSHYETILNMEKTAGRPVQENKAKLTHGKIYPSVVRGEIYQIPLTFKNTGQSVWNEYEPIEIRALQGEKEFNMVPVRLSPYVKVDPGQEATVEVQFKVPPAGKYQVVMQLFAGNKPFDQAPVTFATEVKAPVILDISASLGWKKDFSGEYILDISAENTTYRLSLNLDKTGLAHPVEARYLLPDYPLEFTLSKPFYKAKTIRASLSAGANKLDFGKLEPNIRAALSSPQALWQLLPFSKVYYLLDRQIL